MFDPPFYNILTDLSYYERCNTFDQNTLPMVKCKAYQQDKF